MDAEQTTSTPSLMTVLWRAFKETMGEETASFALQETNPFLAFCDDYLTTNRVVQNFAVNSNHGVVLSNNVRCTVCPEINLSGTMEDSNAVGISSGESQPGQEGVVPVGDEQKVI